MSKWIHSVYGSFLNQPLWLRAVILALLLGVFALLVRIPNYMTIPPLTDEFKEVGLAMDISESGIRPLTNVADYIGPILPYLVAFVINILGPTIYWPRLVVLILGTLTVIATFFFGKTLARGDWRVGAAAALLLANNAHHILLNSHVAWSNDTTPLFTTLAMLAYLIATRSSRPRWLIATGVLYGLALQTHPSVLALVPAFVIDFFWRRESRAALRTAFPYLGVLGTVLAYGPVLFFNLQTNFGSLRAASAANYALEPSPSLARTLDSLVPQLYAMARVAFGLFASDRLDEPLLHLIWLTFAAVTLTACVWMARRGEIFPLLVSICALLVFATFNRYVSIPMSGRYFQFLTPIVFCAWSQAGFYLWDAWSARRDAWRSVGRIGLAVVFAFLCLLSIWQLENHYAEARDNGHNNSSMVQIIETLRRAPEAPVLLEWELSKLRTGPGYNLADNLIFMMRLEARKPTLVSVTTPDALGGLQNLLRGSRRAFLIGFEDTPERIGEEFPLQLLIRTRFPCPNCSVSDVFALYWWETP